MRYEGTPFSCTSAIQLMVGDHIDDVMCGTNANAKSVLFCENQENIEKWGTKADYVAPNMHDVLLIIESLARQN